MRSSLRCELLRGLTRVPDSPDGRPVDPPEGGVGACRYILVLVSIALAVAVASVSSAAGDELRLRAVGPNGPPAAEPSSTGFSYDCGWYDYDRGSHLSRQAAAHNREFVKPYDDPNSGTPASAAAAPPLTGSTPAAKAGGASLTDDVARTFKGGQYTTRTLDEDLVLRRVYGGSSPELGPYWSRTGYSSSGRAMQYLSLPPGNTAESVATIRVPAGTTIHEGQAAASFGRAGGGNQVYIDRVDPSWIVGR